MNVKIIGRYGRREKPQRELGTIIISSLSVAKKLFLREKAVRRNWVTPRPQLFTFHYSLFIIH